MIEGNRIYEEAKYLSSVSFLYVELDSILQACYSFVCELRDYGGGNSSALDYAGSRRSSDERDESGGRHGAPAPPRSKLGSPL